MKRILLILGLILAFSAGAWTQAYFPNFSDFSAIFQGFADQVATSLPATASIESWSHAYIGQFPHFGVGVTAGGVFLPYAIVQDTLTSLNVTLPPEAQFLQKYGLPFPAVAISGRLGGFFFPFDLGFRVGFIPEAAKDLLGTIGVDYLLVGGDMRIPILQDHGFIPALSIGGGYTYLRGGVSVPDVTGSGNYDIDLFQLFGSGTHILQLTAPDVAFTWQTHTFTVKLQLSKNLLLFTPHLGLGAAYGISQAGGGLETSVLYDQGSGFAAITAADIAAIQDAFTSYGQTPPDLSAQGVLVSAAASGFSFWAYGGVAVNLFFIKVDLSAMYNLLSHAYGGSVNVRLQL